MAEITLERLRELQAIFEKLDPERRRAWRLEVYDLYNGRQRLVEKIDIKKAQNVTKPAKNNTTPE